MSVTEPETISSSQRRPRAIAFTRRARRSICVGRTSFLGMPCGTRICLDFLDGGFCHGIESRWSPAASDVSSSPGRLQPNSKTILMHIDTRHLLQDHFSIGTCDAGV